MRGSDPKADLPPDLASALHFRWSDFPPLTEHPGTGGHIELTPEAFQVEEVPLYTPSGSGSHAYAHIEKRGLTTRDLVLALVREGVAEKQIGVAGLKDKHALTRQWLSVPARHAKALQALERLPGVRVLELSRHRNKLGIGHLAGNRFRVTVRGAESDALQRAHEVVAELARRGLPNYFGPQRFGRFGANAVDGYVLVRGGSVPGGYRLKRFFVSALQSLLFNHLLAERVRRGLFETVILGDWAKKHDTGGVFEVDDEAEAERAHAFAISATLPLYGKKVRLSGGRAGELEQLVLGRFGLTWHDFASRHGDRRLSRLPLGEVEVTPTADGYTLAFFLPKGAFATSLLREVMKVDAPRAEPEADDEPA